MDVCIDETILASQGLLNALKAHVAAKDGHGCKERRRSLAVADGHAARGRLSSGCFAGRDRLGHQAHAESGTDAADGFKAWRAVGAQGFVESFAGNSGGLGGLRHAARAGNVARRGVRMGCVFIDASMSTEAVETGRPVEPIASLGHTLGLLAIIAAFAVAGRILVGNQPGAAIEHFGRAKIYLIALSSEWFLYLYIRAGMRGQPKSVRQFIDERAWSFGRWRLYALIACGAAGVWACCGYGLGMLLKPEPQKIAHLMTLLPHSDIERILWVALSVSAAFCEEFIYRGYLLRQFQRYTGSLAAGLVLQAVIFGAAHAALPWEVVVSVTCLGLVFGGTAVLSKSLAPGMLFHGAFDVLPGLLFHL